MIIYLKRLKSSKFVRVKAFPMYGGIGVSAPSLHRESTDSLIYIQSCSPEILCCSDNYYIVSPQVATSIVLPCTLVNQNGWMANMHKNVQKTR